MTHNIHTKIIRWYHQHGRHDLPWQKNQTPYRVWLSEIMLQQTQVQTAIPYYKRFTKAFPNLKQLAQAEQDDVLSLWSGLGYYARARNLHATAKIIATDYHGRFPSTVDELCKLPGIGRSTAGAILSFSKDIPAVILDGNVKRILCRLYRIDSSPYQAPTLKKLWNIAEELTPEKQIKAYNQAVMDIGATVCTRSKPQCSRCPIKNHCESFEHSTQHLYPVKKNKVKKRVKKSCFMLVLRSPSQSVLLEKRPNTGIWGGLWCLPQAECKKTLIRTWQTHLNIRLNRVIALEKIEHTFSHFDLSIQPLLIDTPSFAVNSHAGKHRLHNIRVDEGIGLPAPVTQLLKRLPNVA